MVGWLDETFIWGMSGVDWTTTRIPRTVPYQQLRKRPFDVAMISH